jgi:hypothetical protein
VDINTNSYVFLKSFVLSNTKFYFCFILKLHLFNKFEVRMLKYHSCLPSLIYIKFTLEVGAVVIKQARKGVGSYSKMRTLLDICM